MAVRRFAASVTITGPSNTAPVAVLARPECARAEMRSMAQPVSTLMVTVLRLDSGVPPDGSAALSDATIVNPAFVADIDGQYTLELVVLLIQNYKVWWIRDVTASHR